MIKDIEVRFEQIGLKTYQMLAFFEHIFITHKIDELQDPYCLANLLVFARSLLGEEDVYPIGKYYAKRWEPGLPLWIAYESDARYTWDLRRNFDEDSSINFLFKSGLPYQTKPKTKLTLKVDPQILGRAIFHGLVTQSNTWKKDTA